MTAPAVVRRNGITVLLSATAVAILGQGMALTAAPLLAAQLSRNPIAVSAVTAATYVAVLLVGLPAGAFVDRWPLRRLMVVTDLLRFGLLGCFAMLLWNGWASVALVVALVFLVGVGNSFFDPAAQTAIPAVVGRNPSDLAKANGKLWAIDVFGRGLVGPPLGAITFGLSAALPFGLQSIAFLASAVLLTRLDVHRPPSKPANRRSLIVEIREGVIFLVNHGRLRVLTLCMAAFNLGYNVAFAPLVLFVQDRLHLGGFGFGVLLAVAAVGGIAGGWLAPRIPAGVHPVHVYVVCLSAQAAGWLVIALGSSVIVAGSAMLVLGAAGVVVSVVGGSARQLLTPEDRLRRVVAATRVVGIGSAGIGALLGGIVANLAGAVDASLYTSAGILIVAAAAFAATTARTTS